MRKAKKTDGITAFSKVLSYILIVLLIAAVAAGAVALFANGGAAFYVEYDGKRYGVSKEKTSLPQKSEYVFSVGFLLSSSECSAEVRANPESALAFTADGNPYKFYTGTEEYDDYTGFFEIAAEENTVTLTLPDGASMESALRYKYGTEDIEITNADETDHFELVFSSGSGQVIFTFSLPSLYFGITLDPPSIVF